jgi:hypothetical protein
MIREKMDFLFATNGKLMKVIVRLQKRLSLDAAKQRIRNGGTLDRYIGGNKSEVRAAMIFEIARCFQFRLAGHQKRV